VDLKRPVRRPLLAAGLALLVVALTLTGVAVQVVRVQARMARRVIGKPLGEDPHDADRVYKKSYGAPLDLLLLGDSIAAGLGAERPKHTLGAQLAKRVAKSTRRAVRLHTGALVGSETSMLRAQLAGLPAGYHPDVAVIIVGGNDVTHRVRTSESVRHLREAVQTLLDASTGVVVGTCPDLGALTAVPQPLRSLARLASRQLAAAQRDLVMELGGHVVSLADVVGPFFIAQPDQMFAVDRFHPSSAGYRRTAKAMLSSVLAALGDEQPLPAGHHRAPARTVPARDAGGAGRPHGWSDLGFTTRSHR
jgi:lysophospholipase L1-like esterase